MRELNVMLTCCNIHVNDIVRCLRENPDGRKVNVFATNSCEWELPSRDICDGFVVPRLDEPGYADYLLGLCSGLGVDVVMPISSIDLDVMADCKERFGKAGVKVSIMDKPKIDFTNNKIALHGKYGKYMPREIVAKTREDVLSFYKEVGGKVCCKLANMCGGKGFAVVDDEKCLDIELFHRFGKKHYISLEQLCQVVENNTNTVILQEFVEGMDYTISLLADNGKVMQIAGYVGYMLEFGSIMYGEIKMNDNAVRIAEMLTSEIGLDGNIGIDFILKPDGSVVLLEINPRVNASLPFVREAGCNMIYSRCRQLVGEGVLDGYKLKEGLKMKKYFGTRYYV